MPHHALLHILATTRRQSRGCVHRNITFFRNPSELSSGTCGMRSSYCHQCHIHNRKDFHHVHICMSMIPHKITPLHISINDGVLKYSSKQHPTCIISEFKVLAFKVWRGEVHSKTFASYNLPSKFLFSKYSNNTHLKNSAKSCPRYFSNKS